MLDTAFSPEHLVPPAGLTDGELSTVRREGWFRLLPDRSQTLLLRHAQIRRHAPDALVHGIDDPQALDVVLQGALRVCTGHGTAERPLLYIEPGRWHMDAGIGMDSGRLHRVRAHGSTHVLSVPAPVIARLRAEDGVFGHAFNWLNFRQLSAVMRALEEAATLSFHARLYSGLHRLLQAFGRTSATGTLIDLAMHQGELALLVGGSRQRTNMALRELQHAGVLAQQDWRLVLDPAALAAAQPGFTHDD